MRTVDILEIFIIVRMVKLKGKEQRFIKYLRHGIGPKYFKIT